MYKKSVATVTSSSRREQLQQHFGTQVDVDDIARVTEAVLQQMPADRSDNSEAELAEIVHIFEQVKTDIAELGPYAMAHADVPDAVEELAAVIKATEQAAGTMMDVAEMLGELSANVDAEVAQALLALSTQIFEASTFQDITGQRVVKVTGVLEKCAGHMAQLAEMTGDSHLPESSAMVEPEEMDDEDLLHGPQLEGQGNSQDDIDALLASFD